MVRSKGTPITAKVAIAAAKGFVTAVNKDYLSENGGHIKLDRAWAYSLFKRMGFVQCKPTTSKSKITSADFAKQKKEFLDQLVTVAEMEEIPAALILNWDQTGIRLVPSPSSTMDKKGVKRVEMVGQSDKRQITAVLCGSLEGDFLPIQLVYKGKTNHCHPSYNFPAGWHITHSPNHWSTETTMIQYIDKIIGPYVRSVREVLLASTTAGIVIMDNFKGKLLKKF